MGGDGIQFQAGAQGPLVNQFSLISRCQEHPAVTQLDLFPSALGFLDSCSISQAEPSPKGSWGLTLESSGTVHPVPEGTGNCSGLGCWKLWRASALFSYANCQDRHQPFLPVFLSYVFADDND